MFHQISNKSVHLATKAIEQYNVENYNKTRITKTEKYVVAGMRLFCETTVRDGEKLET